MVCVIVCCVKEFFVDIKFLEFELLIYLMRVLIWVVGDFGFVVVIVDDEDVVFFCFDVMFMVILCNCDCICVVLFILLSYFRVVF